MPIIDLHNPIVQIKLASSVCTFVATLATVIRLFMKRLIFSFDDLFALLSMLSALAQTGIIVAKDSRSFTSYYTVIGVMFYCTVWFSRLSILLTLIRITKEGSRHLFAIVVVFLILLGLLIGQVFWVCEQRTPTNISCTPIKQMAIFQLVSNVIGDCVLLISSLRLFLVIQDKALRFRLSCLFSTCIISSAVSFVHFSLIITSGGMKVVIVAVIEANVCLIVANIPVLSSVFLQFGERGARGGGVVSIVHFMHRSTDTQVSRTNPVEADPPIPSVRTCTLTKTSLVDVTLEKGMSLS